MEPSHSHRIVTSSENPNWRTPLWLWDAIRREFPICIDMASDEATAQRMQVDYVGPGSTLLEDALCGVPWADIIELLIRGVKTFDQVAAFLNPPYSQKLKMPIEPWVELAAKLGEHVETISILPYSTQTEWWGEFVYGSLYRAKEIRRFPYRISFDPPLNSDKPKLNANVNTAVVVWSPVMKDAREPWVPHEWYWDARPKGKRAT